jgi:membrane-associated phospholipid phosphatase
MWWQAWRVLLADKQERAMAIVSTVICFATIAITSKFLVVIEERPGVYITDPVHSVIQPIDLTWLIFFVLYGSLILAIFWLRAEPGIIFRGLRAYSILLTLRMLCIYLLPMEAPPSMILMPDPIIQAVASNTGELLTRDLFFSGHTSVMFMAAFLMPTSRERWLFVALGIVVGTSLVLQHVHYTVDVVVAPMAAMFAVVLSGRRK